MNFIRNYLKSLFYNSLRKANKRTGRETRNISQCSCFQKRSVPECGLWNGRSGDEINFQWSEQHYGLPARNDY